MQFRKAAQTDIPTIQLLADQSWRSAYRDILSQSQIDYMLNDMYSTETLQGHLANERYHYYLAENERKAVGFMGFEEDFKPQITKLHRIYFLAEHKGQGYGKLALEFLEMLVTGLGNNTIFLTVNKNNPARYFYENMGFSVIDEVVADIGGGFVMDDYIMSKSLS